MASQTRIDPTARMNSPPFASSGAPVVTPATGNARGGRKSDRDGPHRVQRPISASPKTCIASHAVRILVTEAGTNGSPTFWATNSLPLCVDHERQSRGSETRHRRLLDAARSGGGQQQPQSEGEQARQHGESSAVKASSTCRPMPVKLHG